VTANGISDGPEAVLVRYGELALKGDNRGEFERALVRNIEHALQSVAPARVVREHGRIFVFPETRLEAVARRLTRVFGIANVSPAWGAPSEPERIARAARPVLDAALAGLEPGRKARFRIETNRVDKRFPVPSNSLDRQVAIAILRDDDPLVVDLAHPELVLGIEVREDRTWLFCKRYPGPGGLPVGTLGRVACLISGGIDSPVAAWMAMKRGCEVVYVTFHSHPFIGESAKKKVVDLVRVLAPWQRVSRLHVVPFADVQLAIRDAGRDEYRTVLYRRMMQRIASRIALAEGAGALVTGECVGQVASQTLENLTCIGAAASLPVLRPLISFDKRETIERAQALGTFEISKVQEPDCCTLFMPRRPVIRGKLEACEELEQRFDVATLVERALAGEEVLTVANDGA
jgi:thiamine biosynthesis protein ThiI